MIVLNQSISKMLNYVTWILTASSLILNFYDFYEDVADDAEKLN